MKYEFHAQYPFAIRKSMAQAFALSWLVGKSEQLPYLWKEIADLEDSFARILVLSQAIATPYKDQARAGSRKQPGGYRYWVETQSASFWQKQIDFIKELNLFAPKIDLHYFPKNTWYIHFKFNLKKPYFSRDDTDFYIIDNPIKKECVFKLPYVAPSQWKGALHATLVRQLAEEKDKLVKQEWLERRVQLVRLFGNEKGVRVDDTKFESYLDKQRPEYAKVYREQLKKITKSGYIAGNLHFYPTYFNHIGIEVINPHERDTGVGTQPIYFECVPEGTEGQFTILYIPLHQDINEEISENDLAMVSRGIRDMLTVFGFGAKTSSGFGLAEVNPADAIIKPEEKKDTWLEVWRKKA